MLGKVNEGDWSVLVMDPEATKIMSAVCRVSEILNFGVACTPHCPNTPLTNLSISQSGRICLRSPSLSRMPNK